MIGVDQSASAGVGMSGKRISKEEAIRSMSAGGEKKIEVAMGEDEAGSDEDKPAGANMDKTLKEGDAEEFHSDGGGQAKMFGRRVWMAVMVASSTMRSPLG